MNARYEIEMNTRELDKYLIVKRTFAAAHGWVGLMFVAAAFNPGNFGTAMAFVVAALATFPVMILSSDFFDRPRGTWLVVSDAAGAIYHAASIAMFAGYLLMDPATTEPATPLAFVAMCAAIAGSIALTCILIGRAKNSTIENVDWNNIRNQVAGDLRRSRERHY